MDFREPVNTETLQKNFPEVYREFFARNELVMSASIDVQLLHDNNTRFRGVAIKQKIPLKVYCGISATKTRDTRFWYYDFRDKAFTPFPVTSVLSEFKPALQSLLQSLDYENKTFSLEFLSEAGRGMGFGVTSKIAAILPVLFQTYFKEGKLTSSYKQDSYEILLEKEAQDSIVDIAKNFLNILRKKDLDISGICSAFSHKETADFCVYGKPVHTLEELENPLKLKDVIYGNLADVFQTHEVKRYFDYYYIYSGQKNPIFSQAQGFKQDKEVLDSYLNVLLKSKLELKNAELSKSLYLQYLKLMYDLSFRFFTSFGSFLQEPLRKERFSQAMDVLNQYAVIKEGIEVEKTEVNEIVQTLRSDLHQKGIQRYAVIRSGGYRTGGGISVITEPEKARETMSEVYKMLKKQYPFLEMTYVSFIDGTASSGLQIEKWQKNGIRSIFDSSHQIMLEDWFGHKTFIKMDDLSKLDYDVVLDMVENKIYINKKPITSKQLHSQRMSLDVLKLLLLNIGQDVANTDLPVSSYSQSKNEMQGKIVIPLSKLILEQTGEKLQLSCKGSNTSFYLRLNKNQNIKLATIHPV